jgi:hypothetical protein
MSLAHAAQHALAKGEHAADGAHGEAEYLSMRRHGYSEGKPGRSSTCFALPIAPGRIVAVLVLYDE